MKTWIRRKHKVKEDKGKDVEVKQLISQISLHNNSDAVFTWMEDPWHQSEYDK
jgi:hypothetical protein